jgi:hypothetical protein
MMFYRVAEGRLSFINQYRNAYSSTDSIKTHIESGETFINSGRKAVLEARVNYESSTILRDSKEPATVANSNFHNRALHCLWADCQPSHLAVGRAHIYYSSSVKSKWVFTCSLREGGNQWQLAAYFLQTTTGFVVLLAFLEL